MNFLLVYLTVCMVYVNTLFIVATGFKRQVQRFVVPILIFVFCLILCFLAYHTTIFYADYTDFDRISLEVAASQTQGLSYAMQLYTLNPLSSLLIYAAAIINDANILKAVAALAIYLPVSLVLYMMYMNKRLSAIAYSITNVLFLLCIPFTSIVLGIRNYPAMALALLGAFLLLHHKRKPIAISLMIIGCLLHFGAIVVIITLIPVYIKNRGLKIAIGTTYLLYPLLSYGILNSLSFSNNSLLQTLAWKMNDYYSFGDHFDPFASVTSTVAAICFLIASVLVYLWHRNETDVATQYSGEYTTFLFYFTLICFGSIPTGTPFRRFSTSLFIATTPLLMQMFSCFLKISTVHDRSTNNLFRGTVGRVFTHRSSSDQAILFLPVLIAILLSFELAYSLYSQSKFVINI